MTEQITAAEVARVRVLMTERDALAKQSRDAPGTSLGKRLIRYRKSEKKKGPLELLNDRLSAEGDLQLHPTKGYRRITTRRMLAAVITERMKAGERGWSTTQIKQVLKGELHL